MEVVGLNLFNNSTKMHTFPVIVSFNTKKLISFEEVVLVFTLGLLVDFFPSCTSSFPSFDEEVGFLGLLIVFLASSAGSTSE